MTCRLPSFTICGFVRGAVNLIGDAVEYSYRPKGVSELEALICAEVYGLWLAAGGPNGRGAIHYSRRIDGGTTASCEWGEIRLMRPGQPVRTIPAPALPPIRLARAPEATPQQLAGRIALPFQKSLPEPQSPPLLAASKAKRT